MIEIYGKDNCAGCKEAKAICEQKGIEFVYKSLNKDYSIGEMYEIAPRSHKTFPMIARNGKYFGTLVELKVLAG